MPRYADDSRDRVREAVDFVAIVSAKTELKRVGGGRYMGLCPFHQERTPSFSVDGSEGLYHCFGCGAGGDVFTFVQETEGLDFIGALESLAQRSGIELEVVDEDPQQAYQRKQRERLLALLDRAASFYERWLWDTQEAAPVRLYLSERGLSEDVLRAYRVGYAPSAWDTMLTAARKQKFSYREMAEAGLAQRGRSGRLFDLFRRRIMFPIADTRGRVVGFGARAISVDQKPKYRNSSESNIFHKGSLLYGAHLARRACAKSGEVIVCEGYIDVLALHQAGYENVVCIMGTAVTDHQIAGLAKLSNSVLLALDADKSGKEAMVRAERAARKRNLRLRVLPLPDGRDPADVANEADSQALAAMISGSVPITKFLIELELSRSDITGAEDKDAVIAALKPLFADLPLGALREELIATAAAKLQLQPDVFSSWLPAPTVGHSTAIAAAAVTVQQRTHTRSEDVTKAERHLLAMLVAAPEASKVITANLGHDNFSHDDFSDPAVWRLAAHVLAHLGDLRESLPQDDEQLANGIEAIIAAAEQIDPRPTANGIKAQILGLKIAQLTAEIKERTRIGSEVSATLVPRREQLEQEMKRLIGIDLMSGRNG